MKLLLITGASSGIGLQTATRFQQSGYTVVNLSRRKCPLQTATHINCDLSMPGFVDGISPQLGPMLEEADTIALVHNAATLQKDSAVETPSNDFRDVLEVNVVAPNTLSYYTIPYMRPGSSVLYVGSTLAEKAVPGAFSYVVSKHALLGMMRATCQDLAGRDIHTACICPGFTDTEMLREHLPAEALERARTASVFGRLVDPAEIAEALYWAAHQPVINGAVIHANLGQTER